MLTRSRRAHRMGIVSKLWTAFGVSALLVATLATPVAAEPQSDPPSQWELVPAIDSPPVELPPIELPDGDFTDLGTPGPADLARLGDEQERPVEPPPAIVPADLTDENVLDRDEFSTTYDVGNGFRVTALGMEPQNVDQDGDWVPISTAVQEGDDDTWAVEDHPLAPEFADSADADDAFSVSDGDYRVGFTLEDASSAPFSRVLDGVSDHVPNDVLYEDVFDDVDLTYSVAQGAVKETLVLDEQPAPGDNSWSWLIDSDGLTLADGDNGGIEMRDAEGVTRFVIPAPIMWDSSAIAGVREADESPVGVSYSQLSSGDWRFTLTADEDWLSASAQESGSLTRTTRPSVS